MSEGIEGLLPLSHCHATGTTATAAASSTAATSLSSPVGRLELPAIRQVAGSVPNRSRCKLSGSEQSVWGSGIGAF